MIWKQSLIFIGFSLSEIPSFIEKQLFCCRALSPAYKPVRQIRGLGPLIRVTNLSSPKKPDLVPKNSDSIFKALTQNAPTYAYNQARNKLETPEGAKSFMRGAQMTNSFKLRPTNFSREGEFCGGNLPTILCITTTKNKTDIKTRQKHGHNTIPLFRSIFFPRNYAVVHLFLINNIDHF